MKRVLLALLLALPAAAAPTAAPALTLDEAVALALKQSKAAQLAQLKVDSATLGTDAARRIRYPTLKANAVSAYLADPLEVKVSQGSLTPVLNQVGAELGLGALTSSLGAFPSSDLSLARGNHTPVIGSLTLAQPLTQLWRIDSGVRAALAAQEAARREFARTTAQLRYAVEELFVGRLLADLRVAEKQTALAHAESRERDAANAHQVGELLDEAVLGLRAATLQARADLTRQKQEAARLSLQLADLIGRPGDDQLVLAPALPPRAEHPLDYWIAQAANNPDRQIAAATVEQATAAVRAARQADIPEISLLVGGYAQDGIPLVSRHSGTVGLTLSWDVFDSGRRRTERARAVVQRRAAETNRDRLEEEAARQLRLGYQDLAYAGELLDLAQQAFDYRRRAAELTHQSAANGLALSTAALDADAQLRKAEADLAGARYQRHLALLRLYLLAGQL